MLKIFGRAGLWPLAALVLITAATGAMAAESWMAIDAYGTPVIYDAATFEAPFVTVVRADSGGVSARVLTSGFGFTTRTAPAGDFLDLRWPNASISGEVGGPALPVVRRLFVAPHGAEVSLNVLPGEGRPIDLGSAGLPWRVMPVQPPVEKLPGAIDNAVFQFDSAAYAGRDHFAFERASIEELGIVRGQRLFLLEVRPLSYDPDGRIVTLWPDVKAQVTFKGGSSEPSSLSVMPGLPGQVLNPEQITTDAGKGIGNYLIIVDTAYETAIAGFAAAKAGQGFSVTTHVVNGDSNTAIKSYIESLWGGGDSPDYILLVGDTDTIPHWIGGGAGTPATDLQYGCMDGDSDWYADIAIGRFPVRSEAQLNAIVDKTLYYEAGVFSDPGYKMEAVFMASTDNYDISEGTHNWVIDNYMDPNGYSYDKLYTVTHSATTQDVSDSFNDGRFFGIYSGHGGSLSWADGPPFSQSDVNNLTNLEEYPVVYSFACVTGTYTLDECFTETWIRAEDKGAVAIWGSSVNSYWTEDDILEKRLFDSIFDETDAVEPRLGPVWNDTMLRYLAEMGSGSTTRRYFEMYNLMGDPALLYFGRECADLGLVNLDRGMYACEDTVDISVIDCNMHSDDQVIETTVVSVDSTTETAIETVTLTENGESSPIARGSIALSDTDAAGILMVTEGDTITVTYTDADDGEGGSGIVVTAEASVDCTQPVITNVQVMDVAHNSATVTFDTDEPTQGVVDYGTSCGALTSSAGSGGLATNVAVGLTGLQENTTYYFIVSALDEAVNSSTDDNGGGCYSFTTADIPNYFTEQFDSDNDLDFTRLTFQPNGTVDFYSGCSDPIASFPSDPAGGTTLSLSDDGNALVTLSGATVSLYGVSYDSFYVGANGYITFTASDGDYTETFADHFDLPRISALFDDLDPSAGGTVSWKQLPDRAVVTFEGVPERSTSNINDLQFELFYSGVIAINFLEVAAADGLAGISSGGGLAPEFIESDLSTLPTCGGTECFDGILGAEEDLIDCGGPCPACQCLTDGECNDGQFCTGVESCNGYGFCTASGDPCTGDICKESEDTCVECLNDTHCNDGQFCNGVEMCLYDNTCMSGQVPCPWTTCNEGGDNCIICDNDGTCEPLEDCYNCPNDCMSNSDMYCGNNICEVADGETCISCPEDCNGLQTGLLIYQYCCGDGYTGNNAVTCSDGRCTADGNTCTMAENLLSCCGDGTCEDIETLSNCPADCTMMVPGEAGAGAYLMIEGFDQATGMMSLSHGVPCGAADHAIQYGELSRANLESYNWGGQECHIGMSGAYDWPTSGTPDSLFFVVVADNGAEEGSYGQSSYGFERPEDTASSTCQCVQNLQYACD